MAGELAIHCATGQTLKALVLSPDGTKRWDGSALTLIGSIPAASFGTGLVALAEKKTSDNVGTGDYVGDFPAAIVAAGLYRYSIYKGASPAVGDTPIGYGPVSWDGTQEAHVAAAKLAGNGLDGISTTGPAGVAGNFREMMVQVWRRFFKKSTLTATQLKTYADDNATVTTTQAVSDDGTTQTAGPAT